MWLDVVCLCVQCFLAELIEHNATQSLSCSVTHCLCSPVTHTHTHKPNDRNMVQAVRSPPGAGSHCVMPLYLSTVLFICISLFTSLSCLCFTTSACLSLHPTSKQQVTFNSFFFPSPPSIWPPVHIFYGFLVTSSKQICKHMQVYTGI